MRLLIDMDSVMAQLYVEWLARYNKDYGDNLQISDLKSWDTHKYVKPSCYYNIYNYLNAPDLFQKLEPYPNSVEVMERLYLAGHDLVIVTAAPRDSKTAFYDKRRWLKKHFPFLPKDNLIGAHRKEIVMGDLLLDDGPHNLEKFPGLTCAMDYVYNRHVETTFRVSNWLDFEKVIKKLDCSYAS